MNTGDPEDGRIIDRDRSSWWRGTVAAVLAGGFLFNLGQGVLRPTLPLYLQQTFSASYWMVTSIATVLLSRVRIDSSPRSPSAE